MRMIDKWDLRYLELCKFIAQWSKDPSSQVGSCIVDTQGYCIALGFNGFPRRVEDSEERLNNKLLKYEIVVHAEVNAMIAARKDLKGCTLYVWPFMPCSRCASLTIQYGFKRVVSVVSQNQRWKENFELSLTLFREAGIQVDLADADDQANSIFLSGDNRERSPGCYCKCLGIEPERRS